MDAVRAERALSERQQEPAERPTDRNPEDRDEGEGEGRDADEREEPPGAQIVLTEDHVRRQEPRESRRLVARAIRDGELERDDENDRKDRADYDHGDANPRRESAGDPLAVVPDDHAHRERQLPRGERKSSIHYVPRELDVRGRDLPEEPESPRTGKRDLRPARPEQIEKGRRSEDEERVEKQHVGDWIRAVQGEDTQHEFKRASRRHRLRPRR